MPAKKWINSTFSKKGWVSTFREREKKRDEKRGTRVDFSSHPASRMGLKAPSRKTSTKNNGIEVGEKREAVEDTSTTQLCHYGLFHVFHCCSMQKGASSLPLVGLTALSDPPVSCWRKFLGLFAPGSNFSDVFSPT